MKDQNQKNELSVADSSFPITVQLDELSLADYRLDEEEFDHRLVQFLVNLLKGATPDSPWIQYLQKQVDLTNLEDLAFVPMMCKSNVADGPNDDPKDNCPYANVCPLMRSLRSDRAARAALVGTECRVEKARIVKLFAQLVSDLKISHLQTTDLLALTKLVQYYILENRLIWELNLYGMVEGVPAVVSQKDGKVFYKREANPAERMLERIRKQIDSLNAQLLASRKDRAALANTMSKNPGLAKLLTGTALAKKHQQAMTNLAPSEGYELAELQEIEEIGELDGPLIE